MIAFRNFALRRGERLLLSNVDIALHDGAKVGVVGRNGCGKSSLFAAVMGEVEADKGDIDLPNRLRLASVAQETPSLPDAAIDFVVSGDTEVHAILTAEAEATAREDWDAVAAAHQKMADINGYDAEARAGKLLHGLGFRSETHRMAVADFSGGWRVRLNLARALMMPSDLLLLDEPTNHLDLDAVLWLEQWLLKYPGMLLMISHDREFLDGTTTHILHLNDGRAKLYTGDYTSFEHQRSEQLHLQQIAFEKEQAEHAHLQAFIDRFKAKASKAKQAQSRMKRLAKLPGTEAIRAERQIHIDFADPVKLPHSLLRLAHVEAGYTLDDANDIERLDLSDHALDLDAANHVVVLHKVAGLVGLHRADDLHAPDAAFDSDDVSAVVSGARRQCDLIVAILVECARDNLFPGVRRDLEGTRPIDVDVSDDVRPEHRYRLNENAVRHAAVRDEDAREREHRPFFSFALYWRLERFEEFVKLL